MNSSAQQIRQVLRKIVRSPLFSTIAVLTLGLGIGGNTALFSVVNGVLLKPLNFEDPERLVSVSHTAPGMHMDRLAQSPALHFTYREESESFVDTGMWSATPFTVTGLDEPERVAGIRVTDGTLPTLGIRPHLGRLFTAEDDSPGTEETVILSYGYWQRRFGGDRGVIGTPLTVDGVSRTVIGVLPQDLQFLGADADLYVPFRWDLGEVFFGNFAYRAVARLKPGVTIEKASQDVARMIPLAAEKFPLPKGFSLEMLRESKLGPALQPLKQEVVGDVGNVLWVLLGTAGLVLLIACANVANLFLVRSEARQQDLAVRSALGASRRQLALDFLRESVVLGVLGGVAGLWLAWGGIRLLVAMGPENLPRLSEIAIDPTVLVFNLGVSILAGVLFGLVPAIKLGTASLVTSLKEGGRGGSSGRQRHRARNALVITQVALALVLLVGSGLMIRSFVALRRVHPGFDRPEEVQTLRVSIPAAEVENDLGVVQMHEQILRKLEQIPGIESVGASTSIPLDGSNSMDPVFVEEFPSEGERIPDLRRYEWIMPGYHEILGVPVLAGRTLTWADIHDRARVVVISESLARSYWNSPVAAVGKRVRETPLSPWREIVGVVGNVHATGIDQTTDQTIYWPMVLEQFWNNETWVAQSLGYVIRTPRVGTTSLLGEVRRAVWSVNPNLPVANVQALDTLLARSMARTSFTLVTLSIAAGVALILGTVGIYGVIAYSVSLRTREFGVRVALGARQRDVSGMVVRHGLLLTGIGVVIGLTAAVGMTRLMAALLFGVSATDPATYALVAAALIAIALAACYVPARRAASISPIEALRWE